MAVHLPIGAQWIGSCVLIQQISTIDIYQLEFSKTQGYLGRNRRKLVLYNLLDEKSTLKISISNLGFYLWLNIDLQMLVGK